MSEAFDPEKVHVWTYSYESSDRSGDVQSLTSPESVRDGDEFVPRADYDKLLALYRGTVGQWRELRDGIDDLYFRLHAQAAVPDTDLPTIEEMRGLLDRP